MNQHQQLSTDMVIQYSIVGLILLAACCWIIWKMIKNRKNKYSGSCCGCSIADSCKKAQRLKK